MLILLLLCSPAPGSLCSRERSSVYMLMSKQPLVPGTPAEISRSQNLSPSSRVQNHGFILALATCSDR